MKKKIMLVLLGIILLFTVSCSDDDGDNSNANFMSPGYLEELEYYLVIDGEMCDSYNPVITIFSNDEVAECELSVNNVAIETEWNNVGGFDTLFEWATFITLEDISGNLEIIPGETYAISLNINGNSYSSDLVLPASPVVDYPEFSFDENFAFSWQLSNDAEIQETYFTLEALDESYNSIGDVDNWEQLDSSERSYSVSKSEYSEYADAAVIWVYADVDLINYEENGDCLMVSMNSGDDYNFETWGKAKTKESLTKKYLKVLQSIR
ncbi:MAG: hypothetical protein U9N34_03350 [Candidatus Cloacimonadota bacterium]|nr:hypothetical protein [Candidatus Cloacimonadota bacterium]